MVYVRAFLLVFFLTFALLGISQSSVVAGGGLATGNNGSVSFSVGQVFYVGQSAVNGKIIQGVEQPYEISFITGIRSPLVDVKIKCFPNPTAGFIILNIAANDYAKYTYQLTDQTGKILDQKRVSAQQSVVDLKNFVTGQYILSIMDSQGSIQSYKILKNK